MSASGLLVDTHAHLVDAVFDDDRGAVLERARQAGVGRVVAVGETLSDAERNLRLAEAHPEILPAAGLYPTHLDLELARQMEEWIRRHRSRLVAIGEVGLDTWIVKDEAGRELQREIFARFIDLARQLELPLNIHSRSAGRQVIALLLEHGASRVQLHAFDGKPASALPGVEAGFFFSIPASVLYSRQKQKLVGRLPLDCLLLETDSPVMAPVRGERNEPANLVTPLRAIAEIKQLPVETVREAVVANTARLYGRDL